MDVWNRLKSKIMQSVGELQIKTSEFEEIEYHFKTKVVNAGQTETFIKDELKEIKERLAVIFVYREREKKMSLRNRKIWLAAILKLEQEITGLKQTQSDLEAQIQQIRQDAEDLHSLEMKKFKEVLYDSELALEKIENERKRDEERLEECQKELALIKLEYEAKINERKLKEQMLQEAKHRITELELNIALYEKENPLIVEKYKSKASIEKELKTLKEKIDQMQVEVDEMNKDRIQRQMVIDSSKKEIETQKSRITSIGNTIQTLETEDEEHIKRIEVYFNRKSRETGMESPFIFTRDYVKRLETMTIADEIRIKNGEVIGKLKNSLLQNVSRTIEVLDEQIAEKAAEVRNVAETLMHKAKRRDKNNEQAEKLRHTLVLKYKTLVSEFRDLKLKKFKTELRLKYRRAAIEKYVSDQKKLKPDLERTIYFNLKYLPTDDEVANHIVQEQSRKPHCVTQEENLEEVVNNFYDLVRDREQKIQNCSEKRSNCNFIIRENQETINELSQVNDDAYYQRKAELTDLKVKVSKLQGQLQEVTANLEIEILDIGDKNFDAYYKKSLANTARKMQKVYGPRGVNQFKGKHKRDITDATYMTEHRKIQNYQAAIDLLEESKIEVEKLQNDLDNVMPKIIHQLEHDIKHQEDKIKKIKVQYTAVVDAEKQLQRHIKNAISNKEEDIKQKTSKLYIETKFSALEVRLTELMQEINNKEQELNLLANRNVQVNDEISQSEDNEGDRQYYEEVNQELIEEEVDLRQRYEALKDAKTKLKTEINPNLKTMQNDRQTMERDIEILKTKIESLYDKYLEVRRAIQNTNEAIQQNNASEEDKPNLGSFVQIDEDDEIDREVKCMRENKKSTNINVSKEIEKSLKVNQSASKPRQKKHLVDIIESVDMVSEQDQSDVETYTLSHFTTILEVAAYGSDETTKILGCLFDGKEIFNPAKLAETGNNKRERYIIMSYDLQYLLISTSKQYNKMSINYKHLIEAASLFLGSNDEANSDKNDHKTAKKNIQHLEQNLDGKGNFEHKIKMRDIHRVVIPHFTRDIVRIQKIIHSPLEGDKILSHKDAKVGKFVHKSKKYGDGALFKIAVETSEYPFTVLFKDFELNIVAKSLNDYNELIKAFNFVLDHKSKPLNSQPLQNLSKITRKELQRVVDY